MSTSQQLVEAYKRARIFEAIVRERKLHDAPVYGTALNSFINEMEHRLFNADESLNIDKDKEACLGRILSVVALGVAVLEEHGLPK